MTAVDRMLQDTPGKVVTFGNGSEASDARVAAQSAHYGFKLHGQHSRISSDLDQTLDQRLDQGQ